VYSIGSLFTSIIPSLVLPGIGDVIANHPGNKMLVLNGSNDRETHGMPAPGFIAAITRALNAGVQSGRQHPPKSFITHLIYLEDSQVVLDKEAVEAMGIQLVSIKSSGPEGSPVFHPDDLAKTLCQTAMLSQ